MTVVAGDTVGHDAVAAGFVRLVDDVRRPAPQRARRRRHAEAVARVPRSPTRRRPGNAR
jgi:hypothetical protein